jgi:hypothetical protein
MEGTWTEKKPLRKTPSSQEKGAVENSGGVKRPHLDSSPPSWETQQPKNPGTLKCRLGRTRMLLLASGWWLFTDAILMSDWISLKLT